MKKSYSSPSLSWASLRACSFGAGRVHSERQDDEPAKPSHEKDAPTGSHHDILGYIRLEVYVIRFSQDAVTAMGNDANSLVIMLYRDVYA